MLKSDSIIYFNDLFSLPTNCKHIYRHFYNYIRIDSLYPQHFKVNDNSNVYLFSERNYASSLPQII